MSISAADWIAMSSVDPAVLERWPRYRVHLVAAQDVDAVGLAAVADELARQADVAARADHDHASAHVLRW